MNFHSQEYDFHDITLVEEADTFVYSFEWNGMTHYAETVAGPSTRELIDAMLTAVTTKEEE